MYSYQRDCGSKSMVVPVGYYHFLDARRRATVDAIKRGTRLLLWRVSIHVLSACTLACTYCRGRRYSNDLATVRGHTLWLGHLVPRYVATEKLKTFITSAAMSGVKHLHLTGGEPTLIDDLPEIITLAVKHGLSTSLVTNGTSPNAATPQYRAALLRAGLGSISISLNSVNGTLNDRLTGMPGAHVQTVDFIRALAIERARHDARNRPCIYLQMVVDKTTIFDLLKTIRFAGALGVDDVRILLVKGMPDRWLTENDYWRFRAELAVKVIEASRAFGFRMVSDDISVIFLDDEMVQHVTQGRYYRPFRGPCYLSMSELTIASNGDVYPCAYHLWEGEKKACENITKHQLSDILLSLPSPLANHDICLTTCTRHIVDTNRAIHDDLSSYK